MKVHTGFLSIGAALLAIAAGLWYGAVALYHAYPRARTGVLIGCLALALLVPAVGFLLVGGLHAWKASPVATAHMKVGV